MTNETLYNCHRLATTNIGIDIGTIVSEKPRPLSFPLTEICNTVIAIWDCLIILY